MSGFDHVLLTRFNVTGFLPARTGFETWQRHRFDLFERICLPSLRAQTVERFTWLVLFADDTPEEYRPRIAAWERWEPFEPCFVADYAALDPTEVVRRHVPRTADHLVTTRLDNDDALAVDFVEEVQRRFAHQTFQVVNFDHGLLLADGRLHRVRDGANPFLSLIETWDRARTVWCDEHRRLPAYAPVIHVTGPPMWVQTVHPHNASRRRVHGRRVHPRDVAHRFAVEPSLFAGGGRGSVAAANLAGGARRWWGRLGTALRRLRSAGAGTAATAPESREDSGPPAATATATATGAGPRYSLVVPTCGRPDLLRRALASVLAQDFGDFEVVVVDDGPDTATAAVVEEAADRRLRCLAHAENRGVSAARNTGIAAARGARVVFFDDDDELLPGALSAIDRFLASTEPAPDFTWGGIERLRDGHLVDRVSWSGTTDDGLTHLGAGTGFALTVGRGCLLRVGGFDESLTAGVDFDLLIRLGRIYRGAPLPEILVRVHLHEGAQLTDATTAKAESFLRIADNHRAYLARHPEAARPFLLKSARLCYRLGMAGRGRRLLGRVLRAEPLRWRSWKTLACLELFGTEELGLRRRLGLRRSPAREVS